MSEDDIRDRVLEAERLEKRSHPPKAKRKWQKTWCPKCAYEISYEPKPGFQGKFKCPHCGHKFKIPVLTDYVE